MNLSEHFTVEEMTFSETALRHGLDNSPPDSAVENLKRLCAELLEPARALLGDVPFHVTSGYRALPVNALVGGVSNSAHLTGRACDFIPQGPDLRAAFDLIRQSELPYDQVIYECAAWIHLAVAADGVPIRRQALAAVRGADGRFSYQAVS